MKPEIIEKERTFLAGYSFFGDPFAASGAWTEENEIGTLWKRFMDFFAKRPDEVPPSAVPHIGYELHIWNQQLGDTGQYEVFVGMEIKDLENVPIDLSLKILPVTRFAVFTLTGDLISTDLSTEMGQWLDAAGVSQTGNFIYNLYDERYRGMDDLEGSEIEVYVPIE